MEPSGLTNKGDLTAADLYCAYGFLLNSMLSHLALLWGNSSEPHDFTLLKFFDQGAENASELSDASKNLVKIILTAAQLSVEATLHECKTGGVEQA
jgi:hypothetical protein